MQYTPVLLLAIGLSAVSAIQWSLQDTDNKTCVIFAAEVTAKLNIKNADNITETISFNINNTISKSGNCAGKWGETPANELVVSFFPDGEKPKSAGDALPWRLFLWFTASNDSSNVAFKLADYRLETQFSDKFNSTVQNFTKSASAELDVKASGTNGFKCSTSGLALSDESTIDLKDARIIAQAKLEKDEFPADQTFEQCLLDSRTSDIVPIVVGACLAGLVAVVLVAYLVGRARAKRAGYASV